MTPIGKKRSKCRVSSLALIVGENFRLRQVFGDDLEGVFWRWYSKFRGHAA
jgi:hypothetical protein